MYSDKPFLQRHKQGLEKGGDPDLEGQRELSCTHIPLPPSPRE